VVKVEMSDVLVRWITSPHCGADRHLVEASAPPANQNPHDLTFFCVAYNNLGWGPADRCFFTEPVSTHAGPDFAHDPQPEDDDQDMTDTVEVPMTVAKTCTYVDVLWQDGTRQRGIPSESIVPFHIKNEQEFLPCNHVVYNASSLDGATPSTIPAARRAGVVRTVCCEDQTVDVSWFKAVACPNEGREVECNDTVSAYDLVLDPGDTCDLGDTVVRLLPSRSSEGETSSVQSAGSKTEMNVGPADLSWVGPFLVAACKSSGVMVASQRSVYIIRLYYIYIWSGCHKKLYTWLVGAYKFVENATMSVKKDVL
jgi:ubiquitin-conjugating enzyme E2 O